MNTEAVPQAGQLPDPRSPLGQLRSHLDAGSMPEFLESYREVREHEDFRQVLGPVVVQLRDMVQEVGEKVRAAMERASPPTCARSSCGSGISPASER